MFDDQNTVAARYERDAHFRVLVDMLEHEIDRARFTPTELREAVIFACIRYEARRMPRPYIIPLRKLDTV